MDQGRHIYYVPPSDDNMEGLSPHGAGWSGGPPGGQWKRPSIARRLRGLPDYSRGRVVAILLLAAGFLIVSMVGEWGALFVVATFELAHPSQSSNNSTTSSSPVPVSCSGNSLGAVFVAGSGILVVYWNLLPFLFGCIGTALLIWARSEIHAVEARGFSSAVRPEEAPFVHRGIFAKGPILGVFIVTTLVPLLIMLGGLFVCV